jgi:ornithine cyclodeaminase/alanine dehydrogenase-like protein (mu-crystallin family)
MTLLITEDDISQLIDLQDCVKAVESGFKHLGMGKAQTKPRREVRIRGKDLPHADPRMVRVAQGLAYSEPLGVAVLHHILSFPKGGRPSMRVINYLIDDKEGDVVAIVESKNLLGMRTGAAGAVGAKYLSKKDSKVAGIVGAGRQGRTQLRFLMEVRPIEKAIVYDQFKEFGDRFAKEMSKELGIDVIASDNVNSLVINSDILVTATPSMSPYVKANWLSKGILVNIIGADDPPKIELEGNALKKADKLVIMSDDSFKAGQIKMPLEKGEISETDIYAQLGEIVNGDKPGRESDDEIIVYHNPGMTLQDLVSVNMVYEKAKKMGLGKEISDPFILK